jgi:hypothetical protein
MTAMVFWCGMAAPGGMAARLVCLWTDKKRQAG